VIDKSKSQGNSPSGIQHAPDLAGKSVGSLLTLEWRSDCLFALPANATDKERALVELRPEDERHMLRFAREGWRNSRKWIYLPRLFGSCARPLGAKALAAALRPPVRNYYH
jgi:hypothetical protein